MNNKNFNINDFELEQLVAVGEYLRLKQLEIDSKNPSVKSLVIGGLLYIKDKKINNTSSIKAVLYNNYDLIKEIGMFKNLNSKQIKIKENIDSFVDKVVVWYEDVNKKNNGNKVDECIEYFATKVASYELVSSKTPKNVALNNVIKKINVDSKIVDQLKDFENGKLNFSKELNDFINAKENGQKQRLNKNKKNELER